jgi:C1A family cysteine protease
MARARFTGIVKVHRAEVKLVTRRGIFTLNPYPKDAPLPVKVMKEAGKDLFGYLAEQEVAVTGALSDNVIFSARLDVRGAEPIQDVQIAPESTDPFAQDLELYFRKSSREVAVKLNDVGIRTISGLYHRIVNNYDEEVRVFADYLEVPNSSIRGFIDKLRTSPSSRPMVQASPRFPVKRGVNLALLSKAHHGVPVTKHAPTTPPEFPDAGATSDMPSMVDLTEHATPVKNQGMRPTCVAHTAAACLETAHIRAGTAKTSLNLSEQYLYWGCKSLDGAPNEEGTFLEHAAEVLLNGVPSETLPGGMCTATSWPYNKLPMKGNESQGPPPDKARKAVAKKKYRAMKVGRLKHQSIRSLKEALAQGHCVGLSVYTYHFWTDDFVWREGMISLPLGVEPDGAHAICLVGYRDDDATHRDGYFIFKNSWDTTWGYGRPDPGYGSLPYRYVLDEAIEAFTLEI